MYETLLRLATEGVLSRALLDRAVAKKWISKEQENEILRIAAEEKGEENG